MVEKKTPVVSIAGLTTFDPFKRYLLCQFNRVLISNSVSDTYVHKYMQENQCKFITPVWNYIVEQMDTITILIKASSELDLLPILHRLYYKVALSS